MVAAYECSQKEVMVGIAMALSLVIVFEGRIDDLGSLFM